MKRPSPFQGSQEARNRIALFRSWLIAKKFSPVTVPHYVRCVERSWEDPVRWIRSCASRETWYKLRGAWRAWGDYTGDYSVWEAIEHLRGPHAAPRRAKPVPGGVEWLAIGRAIWATPGPLGAASFLVCFSSLRVGDVARLTRNQLVEALSTGQTICHQKGTGGEEMRRWVPGRLPRLALARLAAEPGWSVLWQLLSKSLGGACKAIANAIPAPYSPHTFRRTWITYAVRAGVPPMTIADVTGHDSLSALQVYIDREVAVSPAASYAAQDAVLRALLVPPV